MTRTLKRVFPGVLLSLWILVAGSSTHSAGETAKAPGGCDVVIEIKQEKGHYLFVKKGAAKQEPVTVIVGQKVCWVNLTKAEHTATHDASQKGADGMLVSEKSLFDIEIAKKGKDGDSNSVTFDAKPYQELVKNAGGTLKLDYYCQNHGKEHHHSSLVLKLKK